MRVTVVRTKGNYTIVGNKITRDTRVSLKARGLWFTIMSLPPDWNMTVRGLAKILPNGRDNIYTALDELQSFGYCKRTRVRKNGRFHEHRYTFIEDPASPNPEKPDTVKPDTEKPTRLTLHRIEDSEDTISTHGMTPEELDRAWDYWAYGADQLVDEQPKLFSNLLPRVQPKTHSVEEIHPTHFYALYRLCYRAEEEAEVRLLTQVQRGKVASVLGELRELGADLNRLYVFEKWWASNWRSKDRATTQYQPPRPEQVREHWIEAMKSDTTPKNKVLLPPVPKTDGLSLQRAMEMRAKERNK